MRRIDMRGGFNRGFRAVFNVGDLSPVTVEDFENAQKKSEPAVRQNISDMRSAWIRFYANQASHCIAMTSTERKRIFEEFVKIWRAQHSAQKRTSSSH